MEAILSKEIQAGLDAARLSSMRRANRLRITLAGVDYPVLRLWKTGFSMVEADAPKLRGFVDLYDGAQHLFQCLVVAAEAENGEMLYEFKRATAVMTQPPVDFVRHINAPAGLITDEMYKH